MNRLVLLLAATTLTFTATAIYYARALSVEKAKQTLPGVQAATSGPPGPTTGPDSTGAAAMATNTDATDPVKRRDPAVAAVTQHQLDQLRNPVGRAEQKRAFIEMYRQGYASSASYLGMDLSDEEVDRYVEARAERQLQRRQRLLECQVDPVCDESALTSTVKADTEQIEAELLGPERYAHSLAIREASRERRNVVQIRSQLTAPNSMSDTQADKLITTLAAERRKFATESAQNGLELQVQRGGRGAGVALQSSSSRGAADTYTEKMESASRYNQRIIDAASTVLTAGQLAEFKVMQENKLQQYEEFLQEEEVRASARKAAGEKP